MGRKEKKGKKGNAANFMTRNQALKRLQVSLQDFRRLCILKGIYPRVPRKKVHGTNKTYYYTKDIKYLAHEQLLNQFREFKAFVKKIKKAVGRHEHDDAARLDAAKPTYTLDHLVKERYPSFVDALRDMDDALCLVHLFSMLPQTAKIPKERTKNCERLSLEFQNYIIRTHALRRVFLSIKGIYYQAEVFGQDLTWLVPYEFSQADTPTDVDYRVMLTFLEFYETLLKFANFKLYHTENLKYPPVLDEEKDGAAAGLTAYAIEAKAKDGKNDGDADTSDAVTAALKAAVHVDGSDDGSDDGEDSSGDEDDVDTDFKDTEEAQQLKEAVERQEVYARLFRGCKIFLAREVPRGSIEFVVRSFGGEVGWDGAGSKFDENDTDITHMVVDRSSQKHRFLDREYVQPQWIYDSANERALLPPLAYAPGATLPPHLSPFVDDEEAGYVPEQRAKLNALKGVATDAGEASDDEEVIEEDDLSEDEEMAEQYEEELAREASKTGDAVSTPSRRSSAGDGETETTVPSPAVTRSSRKKKIGADDSEKELAKTMMSKKDQRLYNKMQYGKKRKQAAIDRLHAKRAR